MINRQNSFCWKELLRYFTIFFPEKNIVNLKAFTTLAYAQQTEHFREKFSRETRISYNNISQSSLSNVRVLSCSRKYAYLQTRVYKIGNEPRAETRTHFVYHKYSLLSNYDNSLRILDVFRVFISLSA